MELLFSQEEVMEMALWEREQQGIQKGQKEVLQLYKKLYDKMKPLERTNELQEALLDGTKLFSLAAEFGIEV